METRRRPTSDPWLCQDIGVFFVVTNHHGVSSPLNQDTLYKWSKTIFGSSIVYQILQAQTTNPVTYPYGYEHSEHLARGKETETETTTSTSDILIDDKETFRIGPPHHKAPRRRSLAFETRTMIDHSVIVLHCHGKLNHCSLGKFLASAWNLPLHWFALRMDHHGSFIIHKQPQHPQRLPKTGCLPLVVLVVPAPPPQLLLVLT
jgi:hypothetical protein